MWEKEKMLVTSISSFSNIFFLPYESQILSIYNRLKNLSELPHDDYRKNHVRMYKIHCRNQFFALLFPRRQILDSFKLKEFADDIFLFDENGRKISNWVENTVGKGEIARYDKLKMWLCPLFEKYLVGFEIKLRVEINFQNFLETFWFCRGFIVLLVHIISDIWNSPDLSLCLILTYIV